MSLLTWEDKYKVGVAEFDEQHKKLIDLINKLYEAMKSGHGKEILKDILNESIEYAKYHFQNEEKYFTKYGYPNTSEHIEEHNSFRKSVLDLKKRSDEGKTVVTSELMLFLKQWLISHIQVTDKKYGPYLNEKGLR
jgi:hemerythrin